MTVDIQGDGHRGMPQHFGYDLWIHSACQEQRRCRMPQVVEADMREPPSVEMCLKGPVDIASGQRSTQSRAKDELVIFPGRTDTLPFCLLRRPMRLESRDGRGGECDLPPRPPRLGLLPDPLAAFTLKLPAHTHERPIQVEFGPLQPKYL